MTNPPLPTVRDIPRANQTLTVIVGNLTFECQTDGRANFDELIELCLEQHEHSMKTESGLELLDVTSCMQPLYELSWEYHPPHLGRLKADFFARPFRYK
jgi:hypothetical protein